jgi:hypothetical protein
MRGEPSERATSRNRTMRDERETSRRAAACLQTRPRIKAALFALLFAAASCEATPLPLPPTGVPTDDPAKMRIAEATQEITLSGEAGAIQPGGGVLRITGDGVAVEDVVGEDGSFSATLPGAASDVLYLEVVGETDDVFVGAVTGATGGAVIEAPAGPDGDGDGSPDAVDCARLDASKHGRRCEATDPCPGLPELCNGIDDDCSGTVDDNLVDPGTCGSAGCTSDADCAAGQTCVAGLCT